MHSFFCIHSNIENYLKILFSVVLYIGRSENHKYGDVLTGSLFNKRVIAQVLGGWLLNSLQPSAFSGIAYPSLLTDGDGAIKFQSFWPNLGKL